VRAAVDLLDAGPFDVVVLGGGNAALVAALTAREAGRRVLLLERAPEAQRGGNSRHTRNIRCVHDGNDGRSVGGYGFDELWSDLCGVGDGPADEKLAALTIRASAELPAWMSARGVRWQAALAGTLQLDRTNRFFLGGGKALVNTYYRRAAALGVHVAYGVTAEDLVVEGDRCTAVVASCAGRTFEVAAKAVVCAAGGFEANLEWLRAYWGDAVDSFVVRGPRDNDGRVLRALYRAGARRVGREEGFHAVAVDARSPRFDGGIATRIDAIPFGIVVNRDAQRFYDEGEDIWPKRYAQWGRNIARQPGQIAYCLWDSKAAGRFLPPMFPPLQAGSVDELALQLGLDPRALGATVDSYNSRAGDPATFRPGEPDGCATRGLVPPKSNWALPLDQPPFFAVPLRPGITFTYLGVAVDERGRVVGADGTPFVNVTAAGEIMSGNILSSGYLAGFGMTIGTVWGRIAGRTAADVAA